MNSYERFEAVINHQKPDKMPFYFPTIACTVASEIMGRQINSGADSLFFKEEMSWLDGDQAHEEFVLKMHEDAIELNRKLKADVVRETLRYKEKPTKKLDEYTLYFGKQDGSYKVKRFFPQYQSYGVLEDTTIKPRDADELKVKLEIEMKKGSAFTEEQLDSIYKDAFMQKKLADPYFPTIINGLGMGIPMYETAWLEATALEPEFLNEYFMFRAEQAVYHIKYLKSKGIVFINGGGDIASQTGPMYSPKAFRKINVEPLKKVASECEKNGMVYCYRTDGNIWSIFDDMFLSTGVQAYGEVDRLAEMDVGRIRKRAPNLIILGNVSSATLNNGSIEDVRAETRESLEESEGYNYIPGPSNAILHGTPVENIYAMLDEIDKFKP